MVTSHLSVALSGCISSVDWWSYVVIRHLIIALFGDISSMGRVRSVDSMTKTLPSWLIPTSPTQNHPTCPKPLLHTQVTRRRSFDLSRDLSFVLCGEGRRGLIGILGAGEVSNCHGEATLPDEARHCRQARWRLGHRCKAAMKGTRRE